MTLFDPAGPVTLRGPVHSPPLWRILFVAEGVTLAQMIRLRVLAESLDPTLYEVHFACCEFPDIAFRGTHFTKWIIRSLSSDEVLSAVEAGQRVYHERVLLAYAEDDKRLFEKVRPHLVVGDFRLSLVASAPAAKIRLATLINAYWSPHAIRKQFPVPDHPIVDFLGERLSKRFFPAAASHVFSHFAAPVNALRRHFGLEPIGSLADVLTFGDDVLFPDIPELVPLSRLSPSQRYLGAVSWAPDVALPSSWRDRPRDRPSIYVTLGSSGRVDRLPLVLNALRTRRVSAVVATAGRRNLQDVPHNVCVSDFVPGNLAARSADLVICNGGSSTGYQAVGEGTPIVGIPSNLDQYLAMTAIEEAGAGILVRAGTATPDSIGRAIDLVLENPRYCESARALATSFRAWDSLALFRTYVAQTLAPTLNNERESAPSPSHRRT